MPKPGMVKITVWVPEDLMRRAMKVSGLGITATVRLALEALIEHAKPMRLPVVRKSKSEPKGKTFY